MKQGKLEAHRSHSPVLYQLSYAHQKRGQANTGRRALATVLRMFADPVRRALAVAALVLLIGAGCTDDGAASETLRANGFTRIQLTGWDAFSCGKDDTTCTGFEAVGPTGVHVRGAVGCGLVMKGCTVRVTGTR